MQVISLWELAGIAIALVMINHLIHFQKISEENPSLVIVNKEKLILELDI